MIWKAVFVAISAVAMLFVLACNEADNLTR